MMAATAGFRRPDGRISRSKPRDEPFYLIFLKVGFFLAFCCAAVVLLSIFQWVVTINYLQGFHFDKIDPPSSRDGIEISRRKSNYVTLSDFEAPSPRLAAKDAFGIAEKYGSNNNTNKNINTNLIFDTFWNATASVRNEFVTLYGGRVLARSLLHAGIERIDDELSMGRLVRRIVVPNENSDNNNNKTRVAAFRIVVLGGAAAAGYGNQFKQSYGQLLQKILAPTLETLNYNLEVHNFAMPHPPEALISAWCLARFVNDAGPPHVVVWDFDAASIAWTEAYLRHAVLYWPETRLIFRLPNKGEAKNQIRTLLQQYAHSLDLAVLHDHATAQPFIARQQKQQDVPLGFADWNQFGATGGSPHTRHDTFYPLAQHAYMSWLVAMNLLGTLEQAVALNDRWRRSNWSTVPYRDVSQLPLASHWEQDELLATPWQCYTNQEFVTRNASLTDEMDANPHVPANLPELVSNKASVIGQNSELLLPKTQQWYNGHWVLALGGNAKRDKLRSRHSDFDGFVDWRKAYYGLITSGPLELFLPASNASNIVSSAALTYSALVLCPSAASSALESTCSLAEDVTFVVGGVTALAHAVDWTTKGDQGGAMCVRVQIPKEAQLAAYGSEDVGLFVQVSVTNGDLTVKEACSIAYVLWQRLERP